MFGEKKKKASNILLHLNSFQQAEKGLCLLQKMKGVGSSNYKVTGEKGEEISDEWGRS